MKNKSSKTADNRKIFKDVNNYSIMNSITQLWINVLIPFTREYSLKFSGMEIVRISGISQPTASRCLSKLVKLNLLNYKSEGVNKLYYLDLEKPTTKILLNIIEDYKAINFMLLNNEVSLAVSELLKFCDSAIIFGSYASGKHDKNSDLDVVLFNIHDKVKINQIKERYNIEINEHITSYNDFEKTLKSRNTLALEILNNHIILGESSRIVSIFWRREYERR